MSGTEKVNWLEDRKCLDIMYPEFINFSYVGIRLFADKITGVLVAQHNHDLATLNNIGVDKEGIERYHQMVFDRIIKKREKNINNLLK